MIDRHRETPQAKALQLNMAAAAATDSTAAGTRFRRAKRARTELADALSATHTNWYVYRLFCFHEINHSPWIPTRRFVVALAGGTGPTSRRGQPA
jgi:hypothetical protein